MGCMRWNVYFWGEKGIFRDCKIAESIFALDVLRKDVDGKIDSVRK